eukprot:1158253-Pelagomonas_calceolata.AAC.4
MPAPTKPASTCSPITGSKSSSQQGTKRQRAEEPSIAAMNSDLQKRVAALEDSLEREQADRQHDQAKMGFLQDKVEMKWHVVHVCTRGSE